MFVINYGEDKAIEIKVLFSTANSFAKKDCCKGKSIVELLPEKMGEFDGDLLVELINHFQVNSPKLSKDEIIKILDEVLGDEHNGVDLPSLYLAFIKEFDYAGVFKKGMGFTIATKAEQEFNKILKEQS